jgi:hypothetical protein
MAKAITSHKQEEPVTSGCARSVASAPVPADEDHSAVLDSSSRVHQSVD